MKKKMLRILNTWNENKELNVFDKLELAELILALQIKLEDKWEYLTMLVNGTDANYQYILYHIGILISREIYYD